MVLVLIIGDCHIPHRAPGLPAKFRSLLVPGRIASALLTGNLCSQDVYDYLKSVVPDIVAARGAYDDAGCAAASKAGDAATTSVNGVTFAVVPGAAVVPWGDARALDALQRRLGVDVLVAGHSHELAVTPTLGGAGLRIDPGSATGAWAPHGPPAPVPSFVLVDVGDGGKCTVYMYRLPGGAASDELKVEKLVFVKGGGAAPPPPAAA